MPAIVGGFKVVSVEGVIEVGDTWTIVPKNTGKTYAGSGVFNTGDVPRTFNLLNSTNTNDQDAADGNIQSAL